MPWEIPTSSWAVSRTLVGIKRVDLSMEEEDSILGMISLITQVMDLLKCP